MEYLYQKEDDVKRKLFVLFFLLAFTALSCAIAQEKKPLKVEDIFSFKGVSDAQISPCGKWVLFVVSEADFEENGYNTDIWMVSASGGEPFKLTAGPKRDSFPRWSPDGKLIAFLSDREEKTQIWLINPRGGEAWRLTDSKTGVNTFVWAPDGKKIAYTAVDPLSEEEEKNKKEKNDPIVVEEEYKMSRLWIIDIETKKAEKLTKRDFYVEDFSWSPDGKEIAFSHKPTPRIPDSFNSDIMVISVEDGKTRDLVKQKGPEMDPKWSPDGKTIAFASQNGSTDWFVNSYLCLVPAAGGEAFNISKGFDEQIRYYQWSAQGDFLYFLAGEGVNYHIYKISVEGGKPEKISDKEGVWSGVSLSTDGSMMAFTWEDPLYPDDVYVSSAENFAPKKLTTINPQTEDFSLGLTETVQWKSVDGWEMEGLLIKPVGYEEGKKYPLLVVIHGGPAGVFVKSFAIRRGAFPVQTFTNQGYAVFMPNPRGSGNYGDKFRAANVRDWGGKDYQDIMTGVDFLIEKGIADPEKMGVMGWSYGGFMTSWVITQTDRFKAACVGAGVTNLYSFFGETDIPEFMWSYYKAPPWKDIKVYQDHSAMFQIDNAKTPTLILHGKNDMRVPLPQGEELFRALKMKEVPVKFVVYPRQPHGLREPKLQKDAMNRTLEWFDKWVLGKEEKGEEKKE
jgi:dipeptidyl aminopeptidase/acylaminoacyl peptidase